MAIKYGRLDTVNVRATKGMGGRIYSVVSDVDAQNGTIGKVGDILPTENDIRAFEKVTNAEVGQAGVRVAFIATPELNYKDDSVLDRVLVNFTNVAGEVMDAVPVESGDELAISEGMIALDSGVATIEDVKYLTINATGDGLLGVASKPVSGFIAKVDKIKQATRLKYYGTSGLLGLNYKMVYFTVNVA